MKIVLVRHGETDANRENLVQGQKTNLLLNEKGVRQAQALKTKLNDINIDICFTSPLVRCWSTAIIIAGDRVEIIEDSRLLDRNMGNLEGKDCSLYDGNRYWEYDENCTLDGIEGIQSIFDRCNNFLEYLKENYNDKTVLIVSHAATLRAVHHLISKTELKGNLLTIGIDNCCMLEYEI